MRRLLIFVFCLLSPYICFGEDAKWRDENGQEVSGEQVADFISNMMVEGVMGWAKKAEPVYESMKTCTPAEGEAFQIYGMENALCHFKYADYECFLPLDIAKEYADLGLIGVHHFITNGNLSTQSPEAVKMQAILENDDYCSFVPSLVVTIEDENGNEIPYEDAVIVE